MVPLAGAVLPHRHGKGGVQSCRSRRTWQRSNRGLPGTWEILSSPPAYSAFGEPPSNELPVHRHGDLGRWERSTRRTVWYRQAKATKRGETDGRKS